MTIIDLYDVKLANAQSGGHWFEPGTLRFFRSRLPQVAYQGPGGTYFVSSEQFRGSNGARAPRAYTVRRFHPETGDVDTVGEFQAYKHRSTADRAARKLALG